MDRVKYFFVFVLMLASIVVQAQEQTTTASEAKNNISLNGFRYASMLSVSYSYRLWQNKQATFKTGLQTGIGYGPTDLQEFSEFVVPFGAYAEYGKKHRIGIDANIIYQYRTREQNGNTINGPTQFNVVYTNGVFTTSLQYSYNFGQDMRYNLGLGGTYMNYFGSNYGIKYEVRNTVAPFIFFGVRF